MSSIAGQSEQGLYYLILSLITWVMEQSAQDGIHRWNSTGTASQYADGCGCYLEGPWHDKKWADLNDPNEDQPRQTYCASHRIAPWVNEGEGKLARRKAGFQKKPLGWLLTGNLNMSHQCALVAMTTNCTLAALATAEPAGAGERILPTTEEMGVHIWTMSTLITNSARH